MSHSRDDETGHVFCEGVCKCGLRLKDPNVGISLIPDHSANQNFDFTIPDPVVTQPAAECVTCGTPVSYETGFTLTGGLGDSSQDRLFCPACAPDRGTGYTLADLRKLREKIEVERAKYQTSLMDRVGPDVYFAVKDGQPAESEEPS